MDTSKHFITFLKSLHTPGNAELLECIEQGFRHVFNEAETLGNIYAHQIGRHQTPKGDIIGNGLPAPADMITEESEDVEKRDKKKVHKRAADE